ncbi:hypothetical protein [Streptomyces sp. SID1121]
MGEYRGIDVYKQFATANAAGTFSGTQLNVIRFIAQGDTGTHAT